MATLKNRVAIFFTYKGISVEMQRKYPFRIGSSYPYLEIVACQPLRSISKKETLVPHSLNSFVLKLLPRLLYRE